MVLEPRQDAAEKSACRSAVELSILLAVDPEAASGVRCLTMAWIISPTAAITTLHELVAEHLDPAAEPDQVLIGIETDRGRWVQALLAAGYVVFAINPMQVARYRERHSTSGGEVGSGRCAAVG